jgi:uracil-DNA glycosylase family 4
MDKNEAAWQSLNLEVIGCRKCPRLVAWREEVARTRRRAYRDETYWGKPVPGFGDINGRVLVVGLAPGAHGANRTGRMFTGDGSGEFLFRALYQAGFASRPVATSRDDGLNLQDVYISAVCRCVPPGNKPTTQEIVACMPYLLREMSLLERLGVVVALGRIAFDYTLHAYRQAGQPVPTLPFAHGAVFQLGTGGAWLVASYHPSRQNTQTGRLTDAMFASIWQKVNELLKKDCASPGGITGKA